MSEAKFTPGPWTISRDRNGEITGIDFEGKDKYGRQNTVLHAMSGYCGDGAELNVLDEDLTLMAAAPDLYAALATMMDGCNTNNHQDGCGIRRKNDCDFCLARAALKKAQGES